ncbi:hypothetical protein [Leifsonia sp. A12D58]|uniref:hypothetical protein n=1 Tax=Leifsonia sp. A12D58 TaxID=3397674 RepID=UPI0039E01884
MTSPDSEPRYIAEFIDGPLEGHVDSRVFIHGKHSPRISMVVAVEGLESLLWYDEVDNRDVEGELHVRYAFDASDSDPYVVEDGHEIDYP